MWGYSRCMPTTAYAVMPGSISINPLILGTFIQTIFLDPALEETPIAKATCKNS
jgi:hypothetical protein